MKIRKLIYVPLLRWSMKRNQCVHNMNSVKRAEKHRGKNVWNVENVSLKTILVTQKKQGLHYAQEYLRIFLLIVKTTAIFTKEKELYCKDCSRLGRDTACMTARENDKVYNNGQRCGGFIDKKKMNSQRFYCSGNHRGGMSAPKSIGC